MRTCGLRRTLAPVIGGLILGSLAVMALPGHARAEFFEFVRIGDNDGFGFAATPALVRASRPPHTLPADTSGDGLLQPNEFLPDLNRDGGVAWTSSDNFDNRTAAEREDRAIECRGCLTTTGSIGSNWTDLSLSISSPNEAWPDSDGPALPNNAEFRFDFTVAESDIVRGSQIFFNIVFGDYDVNPALVAVAARNQPPRVLQLRNQGPADGLIQARSAVLDFGDVFDQDDDGNWRGRLDVVFLAPADPYTAFDFVELSLLDIVAESVTKTLVTNR